MSKAAIGAKVLYCGHDGYFIADIFDFEGVNVVKANGPVTGDNIIRPGDGVATHHLMDFPKAGFWCPQRGVFVVPRDQVKELKKKKAKPEPKAIDHGNDKRCTCGPAPKGRDPMFWRQDEEVACERRWQQKVQSSGDTP